MNQIVALGVDDVDQRERAAHHDHAEQGEAHRDLVGDQLGGAAHRAEQAVLGARGPAAEQQAVEGDRADGEEVEDADRHVDPVEADAVLHVAPGDDRQGEHAGEDRQQRAEDEQGPDRVGRAEGLLGEQLADVGKRLQQAEGADPVGPVAVLEAADQLALQHRHQRQDAEDHAEDDQALDHHDPGGFDELGVGDRQRHGAAIFSIWTETGLPLSRALALASAMPSISRQVPSGTRSLIAHLGADARAVLGDRDLVAGAQAEALGVGDRELDTLLRGQEPERRVQLRDRAGPQISIRGERE